MAYCPPTRYAIAVVLLEKRKSFWLVFLGHIKLRTTADSNWTSGNWLVTHQPHSNVS